MSQSRAAYWRPVAVAAGAAMLVAVLGATITDIGPWYQSLAKPSWQPPDWVFGPAWTLIFSLIAMSGVVLWRALPAASRPDLYIGLYALNGALNLLWSLLFFRMQRPDWAMFELAFFWASIVLLIITARRVSPTAGWLLVPYLVWVTFAGVLNWYVVRLNEPF